jgi:hypothetical protein
MMIVLTEKYLFVRTYVRTDGELIHTATEQHSRTEVSGMITVLI